MPLGRPEGYSVPEHLRSLCTTQMKEPGCVAAGRPFNNSAPAITAAPARRRRELELSVHLRHPVEQARRRQGRPCRSADYSGSCRELSRSARRSKTPIERQGNHEPVEEGVCVLPYSTVCLPPVASAAATIGPLLVRLRANTRNEQNRRRQPALIVSAPFYAPMQLSAGMG